MFSNLIQVSNYWHPNVTIKASPTRLKMSDTQACTTQSLFSVCSWTTGRYPGQVFCLNMLSHVRQKRLNRFYSTPGIKSRFNHLLRRCYTTIKISFLITFEQGCTNLGRQVARTIRFCMAPSDVCGSSIWNWPCSSLGAWRFWGGSYTCSKLVHPCNWVITQNHVRSRPSRRTDSLNCSRPISRVVLHQAHSGRLAKQCRSLIRLSVCHHIHAGGGDIAPTRTRALSPSLTSPITREKCGVIKATTNKNQERGHL
jgi:hypothetical protein